MLVSPLFPPLQTTALCTAFRWGLSFDYNTSILLTCSSNSWVYPTEVFPLATRAKGVSLSMVSFAVWGAVINEVIPYVISAVGWWVFIMFAVMNFFQLIPVWLFYVETANRHLEDLDILFASDSPLAYKMEREFGEKKRALGFHAHAPELVHTV